MKFLFLVGLILSFYFTAPVLVQNSWAEDSGGADAIVDEGDDFESEDGVDEAMEEADGTPAYVSGEDNGDVEVGQPAELLDKGQQQKAKLYEEKPQKVAEEVTEAVKEEKPRFNKSAMRKTKKACELHKEADAYSAKLNDINPGKKLWTEATKSAWLKVYRKKGYAFIHQDCF